jgi:serine/threonine protein kinase
MRNPLESVYPAYDARTMTLAESSGSIYHKKIDLLRYASRRWADVETKDITAREIRRCEFLRQHTHPNICQYHSVTLDEAGLRVSGLIFDRYDGSLHDNVRGGASFDAAKCLRHLKRAIEHLHSLGLVHCDIKPDNIFVRNSPEHYVLGDFDSTHYDDTFWRQGWDTRLGSGCVNRTRNGTCVNHVLLELWKEQSMY